MVGEVWLRKNGVNGVRDMSELYFNCNTNSMIATILALLCFIPIAYTGLELNSFIKHFEPLYYDNHKLKHHLRVKRNAVSPHMKSSANGDNNDTRRSSRLTAGQPKAVKLDFSAHNRIFRLVIRSDSSLFAADAVFESTERGLFDYHTDRAFRGYLEDDEDSHVEGVITSDGLIDGFISTQFDEYYIEPAIRYFSGENNDFHSVIYKLSSVSFPAFNATVCRMNTTSTPTPMCSSHAFYVSNMNGRQAKSADKNDRSLVSDSSEPNDYVSDSYRDRKTQRGVTMNYLSGHQLLIDSNYVHRNYDNFNNFNNDRHKMKTNNYSEHYNRVVRRKRRDMNNKEMSDSYRQIIADTSGVHVNVDTDKHRINGNREKESPLFYWRDVDSLHYSESEPYGVRAVQRTHWPEDRHDRHVVIDPKKTTCMLYLQADHLFYEKMGSDEACIEAMTRHVQKVNHIYRTTDFDQDGRSDNISFLIKRIKVHTVDALKDPEYRYSSNYGVEKFLELFSEEDYDAFCLAYMFTYRDFEGGTLGLAWTGDLKNAGGVCEKNGHYRGSLKSLNTGIVTLLNYGKHVPPIVSHVTLAHEIGHNFGSPHDPEDDGNCTPGGENGNYIMFARATSGDKRNNNKFSPCSLKSINAVLNTKARSLKGCFQEPQDAICGNEVVESGEECDCGWEEDCKEPCCFPMRSNAPHDEIPCRLRPSVICSPSQGPCCTQDCKLKVGNKCRDDNGCRTASYCNGQSSQCPPSTNKPNKTICNEEYVCYMGECTGSICMAYGLESCQCRKGPYDPITKTCELCCRLPSDDFSCKSSFEWNSSPFDVPDLYAKPGTPCDNYNGYCDVFQKCREVDPSGPLATLRRLLLSNESMASLKRWFNEQWFYVAILCLIATLIVAMVVRVFGKRAPDLSKSDLVDAALEAAAAKQKRSNTLSSSLSSINGGLSRSALVLQNNGNLVKTSLAFHHHQQQQQQLQHQCRLSSSSSSLAHNMDRNSCPPLAFAGNGWV